MEATSKTNLSNEISDKLIKQVLYILFIINYKFPSIVSIHDLHIWTLSTGKDCISLHIVIDDKNKYLCDIKNYLEKNCKFISVTLQLETIEESLILNCENNL